MSKKTRTNTSLNSLERNAKQLSFEASSQTFVLSAPSIEALAASSILCRSIRKSGGQFHLAHSFPLVTTDFINEMRDLHEDSQILVVGLEIQGKKRIKKGKDYPTFVGCSWEADAISDLSIGGLDLVTAPAYMLVDAVMEVGNYELQLAAIGTLLEFGGKSPSIKAGREILAEAKKEGLIEEKTGFRMFGANALPLDDVLMFSTRPYLKGISGNRKTCDDILNNADIPTAALGEPITSLSPDDAQRLNQYIQQFIIEKGMDIKIYLGKDYIFNAEEENSLVRTLSSIEGVHATSWARGEIGAIASILLGDRGASLRRIREQHMEHQRDVISAIQHIESSSAASEGNNIISLPGSNDAILTDVGRILLESQMVEESLQAVAVNNERATEVVWNENKASLYDALRNLLAHDAGANPITTSQFSLRFPKMGDDAARETISLLLSGG